MHAFAVFTFLWALSGLLDMAPSAGWNYSPAHALYTAACVAMILYPNSERIFAALLALRLATFAVDSPVTANHRFLYAVVAATILAAAAPVAWRARSFAVVTGERWREAFAPMVSEHSASCPVEKA